MTGLAETVLGSPDAVGIVLSTGLVSVVATTVVGAGVSPMVTTGVAIFAVFATICDTEVPGARLRRLPAAETGMVMYLVVTPGVEVVIAGLPVCVLMVFR